MGVHITLTDRGAIVTESSIWLLDGHGRYRRSARRAVVSTPSLDGVLDYDDWRPLTAATFVGDTGASVRARLLPEGRTADAFGVLTGVVVWTNLSTEPLLPHGWFGPVEPWFPPSPVPADRDLWPDELPFTAFGQFGPDALDLRVFDQGVYWVDRLGRAHHIDTMSVAYLTAVTTMLSERATEFHQASLLREAAQSLGDAFLGRVSAGVLVDDLGIGSLASVDARDWLESTPLMRRLRRDVPAA